MSFEQEPESGNSAAEIEQILSGFGNLEIQDVSPEFPDKPGIRLVRAIDENGIFRAFAVNEKDGTATEMTTAERPGQ